MTTGVEWVKNPDNSPGFALNPVDGCQETAPECDNCYARIMAAKFARRFKTSRYVQVIGEDGGWNGNVVFHPEVLDQPRKRKKRSTYFVGDMADIALPGKVQDEWLEQMWTMFEECDRHIFLVLSKHPHRILNLLKEGDRKPMQHVWVGTTVGHPTTTYKLRYLRGIAELGYNTFISAGPLLGRVDYQLDTGVAKWLILEGESQPEPKAPVRPCYLEDMEAVIGQCRRYGVSVFVKQLGTYPLTNRAYEGRTVPLSEQEYEMLKKRIGDERWLTPQTRRYVTNHKKGGGESMDEFPRWAQVRELPYLFANNFN
jgi:protein gp37